MRLVFQKDLFEMKVSCGIVTYNPDLSVLKKSIITVLDQVEVLIVVDNYSQNRELIKLFEKELVNIKTCFIYNEENRGIASALNQILKVSKEEECNWLLTLDQDSICKHDLVKHYKKICSNDYSIGQLTCRISDRSNGILNTTVIDEKNEYEVIDSCITSGAFNNVSAVDSVGGFDEELFIDGVDIDLSIRLSRNGYKIGCIRYEGMIHTIGAQDKHNIINEKLKTFYHSPLRNYYARRNFIIIAKRYYKGFSCLKLIAKQIIIGFGVVIIQDQKRQRLKYNVKGIIDGLRNITSIQR